jgi:hypothetical protein
MAMHWPTAKAWKAMFSNITFGGTVVSVDVHRTCDGCGNAFRWSARQRAGSGTYVLQAPTQCASCRTQPATARSMMTDTLFCEDCEQYIPAAEYQMGDEFWGPSCQPCLRYRTDPWLSYNNQAILPERILEDLCSGRLYRDFDEYQAFLQQPAQTSAEEIYDEHAADPENEALALWSQAEPESIAHFPNDVITPDIERLVGEAFADFEDRRRTVWEWLNGVDLRGQQMNQKLRAARDAQTLIGEQQRIVDQLTHLSQSRSNLRRQQLEAMLAELNLKAEIVEKLMLTGPRLRTLQMLETQRQQALLPAPVQPTLPEPSHYQQLVGEHLEEVQAKSGARRAAIRACRAEVREIMDDGDLADEETGYEIRAILDAYGLPETALQKSVQKFLADLEEGDGD